MSKAARSRGLVFIATSLDGYISRTDGSIDWLMGANSVVPPGEDCGYAAFMAGIDALVMGRATFEQVLSFPAWPYGDTPVIVLSRTLQRLPAAAPSTVSLTVESPAALVQRTAASGLGSLYIDGGRTIQSFLAAGLIDELTITRVPVLLGSGRPLFGPLHADVALDLVESRSFPFGFVQDRWRVRRD